MRIRIAPRAWVIGTWVVLVAAGVAAGIAVHRLWEFHRAVERLAAGLTLDVGPESTLIYDGGNNLISALYEEEHRIAVPLDQISAHLVNGVLVTEDRRFFAHDGLDARRIVMAAVANLRAGEIVQGGSTITQQLVRSILLSREKSFRRKFIEAILARRIEERYGKRAILEAYLNRVYFGDGYYGVQAAAVGYFGKPASALDVVESATLAGLIKGPSLYSPTRAPRRSRARRAIVLGAMRDAGMLSQASYEQARDVPVATLIGRAAGKRLPDPRRMRGAEYFRDAVAREVLARFGEEAVYTGGLRVYTTLDRRLQSLAEEVMASRLHSTPAGGAPLQGALVALDPSTGFVKAIVGGRDFQESPFNRALDAKRQPGSAFKPFIFAQALESGLSPSTRLEHLDEPIPTREGPWLPSGEHEVSSVRLRDALVSSSNRAAAHLLQQVGIRETLDLVSRFGIASPMPAVPSVALGTGEVSLYELTSAYGVFANRGLWRAPTTIRRVLDRFGRELYRAPDAPRPVISDATAYLMTSMMADVLTRGTASTARGAGFTARAAGKTGTSNDYTDAWFVGYTPRLVTGVWIGYDTPRAIDRRAYASVIAVPVWARFMAATSDRGDGWFEMPGSLEKVRLCRLSGRRATDRCHLPVLEAADEEFAAGPVYRDGGTFEELRQVARPPELCPLAHVEALAIERAGELMPLPPPVPPASIEQPPSLVIIPGSPVSGAPPSAPRRPAPSPPPH